MKLTSPLNIKGYLIFWVETNMWFFGYLKEKIKANIQNWIRRNVFRPAKEILINMVAQALTSFAMNVFLLPLELIHDLENCMSKFF